MKNASLSRGAVRALLLSLALSGSVAFAQQTPVVPTDITPVTEVVPAPETAATSRLAVPAQTKALQAAIKDKNWDAARAAIMAGADVNAADKGGVTVLMRAADASQSGLVELLLQNGANPNLLDKKGQSALHYAIPADPKPKKKFGLGSVTSVLGAVTGVGLLGNVLGGGLGNFGSLLGGGGLESMMGANLNSLLSGQAFNLSGSNGWSAIAGAALQGDKGNLGIGQLLGGGAGGLFSGGDQMSALTAGNWTNLLSSVKGSNPQILGAMNNLGGGINAEQSALWGQFLNAASSGDQAGVAKLMQNPDLAPLLQQATSGLGAAASQLPGNASRTIVSTLLKSGAKADAIDAQGKSAAALAQERGLTDFGPVFATN